MHLKHLPILLYALVLLAGGGCKQDTIGQASIGNNATQQSVANQPVSLLDITKRFAFSATHGFYGTVETKGYVEVKNGYAFFQIEETDNLDFLDYLAQNKEDAFLDPYTIGLGCVEGGRISSENYSDADRVKNTIEGEDFEKLMNSSAENLVTMRTTKPIFTLNPELPRCYSHFRIITI